MIPLVIPQSEAKRTFGATDAYAEGLAAIESRGSGDYKAIGPTTKKGDRALGRYQIMLSNLPSWSKEAIGRTVTEKEFISNPKLQDAIAKYHISKSAAKFKKMGVEDVAGNVASEWFSGQPLKGNNRKDITGTSVPEYVTKFKQELGTTVPTLRNMPVTNANSTTPMAPQSVSTKAPEKKRSLSAFSFIPTAKAATNEVTRSGPMVESLAQTPSIPQVISNDDWNSLGGGQGVPDVIPANEWPQSAPSFETSQSATPRFVEQLDPNKKTGVVQDIVQGAAKPFLRAGLGIAGLVGGVKNLAEAGIDKLQGDSEGVQRNLQEGMNAASDRERDLGYFGKVRPLGTAATTGENVRQAIGTGLEIGSNIVGGGGIANIGKSTVKGLVRQGLKTGAKEGAVAGLLGGTGRGLQEGKGAGGTALQGARDTVLGGAAGTILGGTLPLLNPKTYGKFADEKITSLITKAIKPRSNNSKFTDDLGAALPYLNETQQATGQPVKNLDDLLEAVKQTKKMVWGSYESIKSPDAKGVIDGNEIADAMESSIDRRFALQNPAKAEGIKKTAATYRRNLTIDEAEEFLQSANNDLDSYYARNKVKQDVAKRDPEVGYIVREADSLRNALYRKLDELTGKDAAQVKRIYGALSNLQGEVMRRTNVAARSVPDSFAEQLGFAEGASDIVSSLLDGKVSTAARGVFRIASSKFLKDRNTTDALIERAFKSLAKKKLNPADTAIRSTGNMIPRIKDPARMLPAKGETTNIVRLKDRFPLSQDVIDRNSGVIQSARKRLPPIPKPKKK